MQLFVPSEFGFYSVGAAEGNGLYGAKSSIHTFLRELGLPYTLVFTGFFPDYSFVEYVFQAIRVVSDTDDLLDPSVSISRVER